MINNDQRIYNPSNSQLTNLALAFFHQILNSLPKINGKDEKNKYLLLKVKELLELCFSKELFNKNQFNDLYNILEKFSALPKNPTN